MNVGAVVCPEHLCVMCITSNGSEMCPDKNVDMFDLKFHNSPQAHRS